MKVVCRRKHPTAEENLALGYEKNNATGYELTVDQEYTVLGMNFQLSSPLNKGTTFLLRDDTGRCAFVPICLVEITGAVPSKFWLAKKSGGFDLLFWPEEFFAEYFFDDLSNDEVKAVGVFSRVCQMLDEEEVTH